MFSLELWTKNSQGERTYQGTYRRTWKTMRGLENFRYPTCAIWNTN